MTEPRAHRIYLFEMRSGRKKVSWGRDPDDALAVLSGSKDCGKVLVEIDPGQW